MGTGSRLTRLTGIVSHGRRRRRHRTLRSRGCSASASRRAPAGNAGATPNGSASASAAPAGRHHLRSAIHLDHSSRWPSWSLLIVSEAFSSTALVRWDEVSPTKVLIRVTEPLPGAITLAEPFTAVALGLR